MKKKTIFWIFIFFILVAPASSVSTYNFLTKGYADTLYCKVSDGCGGSSSTLQLDTKTLDLSNNFNEAVTLNVSRHGDTFTNNIIAGTEYFYGKDYIFE